MERKQRAILSVIEGSLYKAPGVYVKSTGCVNPMGGLFAEE